MPLPIAFLEHPVQVAGWVVLAAVAGAVTLSLFDSWRRRFVLARQNRLQAAVLEQRLEAAREGRLRARASEAGWNGSANFIVSRKVRHGDSGICSFYLKPKDPRLKLAHFRPGQHLVFKLPVTGRSQPLVRRYSLSDRPGLDYYRVSIKLVGPPRDQPDAPPGAGSSYFHEQVCDTDGAPGSMLLVASPDGSFCLDPAGQQPVVLIAGGIGLTPMLSMFNSILADNPTREAWLFYGVRNSEEDILFDDGMSLSNLSELLSIHPNLHLHIAYSQPLERDAVLFQTQPERYHTGRVGVDLLKSMLPSNNYHFYVCGPQAMMDQIEDDLFAWGVPEEDVMSERFGPPKSKPDADAAPAKIVFSRSGKEETFTGGEGNLLEFAEKVGVSIPSDCRSGACGQCKVAIVSGKVKYPRRVNYKCPPGSCLTCSSVPEGDLELDC